MSEKYGNKALESALLAKLSLEKTTKEAQKTIDEECRSLFEAAGAYVRSCRENCGITREDLVVRLVDEVERYTGELLTMQDLSSLEQGLTTFPSFSPSFLYLLEPELNLGRGDLQQFYFPDKAQEIKEGKRIPVPLLEWQLQIKRNQRV